MKLRDVNIAMTIRSTTAARTLQREVARVVFLDAKGKQIEKCELVQHALVEVPGTPTPRK